MSLKTGGVIVPHSIEKNRMPCNQQGLQSQDRHLFLFNDLLLIAKARSGGNFKLKDKVRISELWLATCVDEVVEVSKSRDTSFVIGWPTTNVVATFRYSVISFLFISLFISLFIHPPVFRTFDLFLPTFFFFLLSFFAFIGAAGHRDVSIRRP